MSKQSAGMLVYRFTATGRIEVLLVHPGGPFFSKKDAGVWSIPKGEYDDGEEPLRVALREFEEETGNTVKAENFIPLAPVRLKSGKQITAWAIQDDFEEPFLSSNEFIMEWPPKSGIRRNFPEVDKAGWFTTDEARQKINPAQAAFLDELTAILDTMQK